MFSVRERNVSPRLFFYAQKHMLVRKRLIINFGGYIFLCLPPYIRKFRYLEINPLIARYANVWDAAVICTYRHCISIIAKADLQKSFFFILNYMSAGKFYMLLSSSADLFFKIHNNILLGTL